MEFLTQNYINTTTMISVNSNTITAQNIFNPDQFYQYVSDGYNDDSLTSTIVITLAATLPVSRIALIDTNVKAFNLFYNGATANAFQLAGAHTTASMFTGNSAASIYLRVSSTVMCSSITLEMKSTQVAGQEKVLGKLFIGDLLYQMERIPDSGGFKPKIVPKQVVHRLSDGGVRLHQVRKKNELNISLDYVPEEMRDSLYEIYERQTPFTFAAFGTSTGIKMRPFEAIWDGPFTFFEYSDNAEQSGFSGSISLKETS